MSEIIKLDEEVEIDREEENTEEALAGVGSSEPRSSEVPNRLGNGIEWKTMPALQISCTVSFVSMCTFDLTIFGKATV